MRKNPIEELSSLFKEKKLEKYEYIDKMHVYNKTLFYLSDRLKDTDIEKIEIEDDLLLFTTRRENIKLVFNGLDRRGVPFDILNFGRYEYEDETMLFNLLDEESVILDIGANIGWYSLLFSKRLRKSKIYSFEPISDSYNNLIANIVLNGSKNIIPFNIGLSEKEGTATYFYFPEGSVLASERNLINCPKAKKILCEIDKLDNFVESNKLDCIDLIKCDVEGSELSVIKGGIKAIQNFLPIIFIELFERWTAQFNYHPNDVIDILGNNGYHCFLAAENRLDLCQKYKESEEERLNFFFLHSKKHAKLINKFCKNHTYEAKAFLL